MQKSKRPLVVAAVRTRQTKVMNTVFFGAFLSIAALWAGKPAFSENHQVITESHGYNEFGDLKYPADFPHLDYVNPNAPLGGEISVATIGTFDSMNPYATRSGTPAALSSSIWETIMTTTDDEVGSNYCLLCETMEYPEDRSWLILNMRDDVTFSDGTPMTAEDVVFTIELLLEQGTPSAATMIRRLVQDIEVIEDNAIKITFNEDAPSKGRISQMGIFPVMPKAWFEETGARMDESALEFAPGSGEYVLADMDVGRTIVYERNPDYWGQDVPINVGRGNYDRIRIEYFTDTSTSFEGFKAGEYTFRRESSSINWATSYDFPAIDNGWVVKDELPDGTLPGATGFIFNMDRAKFADRRVRRAIGLVYNFNWTNENLQYGLFQQRESFWENDALKAVGLPEGRELEILETLRDDLPEEIFTQDAFLPHTSGTRPLDRGNLRQALALMEEAGWTTGADGLLRNADGNTLDVEFLETRQSFDRILNPYIENLRQLGVNITYNRVDPSQYQARRQAKNYDMIFGTYTNGLLEGRGFGQRYECEGKDDVFNPAAYCSAAIDVIADLLPEAEDFDEMSALVRAADRIMRYDYFIVPTWYQPNNWVAYFDYYEYPENLPEFGLGHLDYWWVNQDKYDALSDAGALQ